MSDVLEGGPGRSGPPRWVWLVGGVVAVVAVGVYTAVGADHPDRTAAGPPSASAAAPVQSSSPSSSASPWPSAPGACGATAYRPQMTPRPLTERTGVRMLVGGYGLRLVDADTGTARPVDGIPADARHVIGELVPAVGAVYVLAAACDAGSGRVYRLRKGIARPLDAGPISDLLAGPDRVWAVNYPVQDAGPAGRVVLRPLGGGRSVALPPDGYPVADTSAGLVVAVSRPEQPTRQPRLILVDPGTGKPGRTLAVGAPLVADRRQLLLLTGPCDQSLATPSCSVARIDIRTGRLHGRYPLPNRRVPASPGAVSRDGRLVAFQLARARPDPRSDPGHPVPPSDLALLHLDTGRLDIVPGLELAPKTAAGLAFTPDGSWLFATVSDGDHGHLLGWHPGLDAPRSVARLAGPLAWAPPVLIT